ncbi:RES family NAD+ phosphorylase [Tersicoccus sp. MR15.9]|uniref:RES family NAD+ phosphorylase n=1 Tax=Tersicoccus mangrovi TaxID=3121635 RepID=UPI002FE6A927
MTRDQSFQDEPDPSLDFSAFPSVTCALDSGHRAHSADFGPGWYSSSGDGRFDLAEPLGTLYSADDVETATREYVGPSLRGRRKIKRELAERFVVSEITLPEGKNYADLGSRTAERFDVIRELLTTTDYDLTQTWAHAFEDRAKLDGVRYPTRFTLGEPNAWALYGPAGADPSITSISMIDGPTACTESGLQVVDGPGHSSSYRKIT